MMGRAGTRGNYSGGGKPRRYRITHEAAGVQAARLFGYRLDRREINGIPFVFIVHNMKGRLAYTFTVEEIADVLHAVPADDLAGLDLVVFREPPAGAGTSCCWGRLDMDYGGRGRPAIVLYAADISEPMVIRKPEGLAWEQEIKCLKREGHRVVDDRRLITITSTTEALRRTQLYRVVFHQVGHYVDARTGQVRTELTGETQANRYAGEIKRRWICDICGSID